MEAPPGIDANETRGPLIIGVVCFVLSVAFFCVAVRTYTRAFMLRQFGTDDWIAIITFLLIVACGFSVAINTKNGFGRHVYFLTQDQITSYLRTFYVTIVLYNAGLAGIKMTFLFQYYRVLAIQKMKKVYLGAMILVGGWSVSQILVQTFVCTPIAAFWDKSVNGTCIPNYPQWYINAAGNIITDLLVLVLPLPAITKLKLAKRQKLVLVGIFCLGFFTCTISFVRIRFLHLAEDFTWDNVESAGWSVGELCCGLVCACLPTFRPLVSRLIPALSSRVTKSSKYHNKSYGGTDSTSKHRDVELGTSPLHSKFGGSISHNRCSKRRPESFESKTDFYGIASYDLSHTDSVSEFPLPIQGAMEGGGAQGMVDADVVPSPLMFRQQPQGSREAGYRSEEPSVETHIEAGERNRSRSQSSGPIEVQCDIVQVSSPRLEARRFS